MAECADVPLGRLVYGMEPSRRAQRPTNDQERRKSGVAMQRLALTGACLGLLAALGACAGKVTASDSGPAQQEGDHRVLDGDDPDESPNPTAGRTGPLPDGRAASCVESYAPKAVIGRAFAFDGVVVEVGPSVSDRGDGADLGLPGVTFEVREWFSVGRADTVTVDMQSPTTGSADPSEPGYAFGVGSRLLVSGEARWGGSPLKDPIAWGCGFSRYYDPETATAWRDAIAR
jgi:hypothetical protein